MPWFISTFAAHLFVFPQGIATFRVNHRSIKMTCPTIVVDPSGGSNFASIQAAINSVPSNNRNWICILIKQDLYREQVTIPFDKSFIYLEGAGRQKTNVVWNAHDSIATSATFTSQADNIIAKRLSFMNSYNYPLNGSGNPIRPALAAMIEGDKSAFYGCRFLGLQDTLWDIQDRHYFNKCTIQGAVDFIFGSGQSLYESYLCGTEEVTFMNWSTWSCIISVVAGALSGVPGYITAQGRSLPNETNGFVLKNCNIIGNGKTFLGRSWRDYARVIFYSISMSDIIVPQGWDAWFSIGHEDKLTFDEIGCRGLGSNTSGRVNWANKLNNKDELQSLASISYIDGGGWL